MKVFILVHVLNSLQFVHQNGTNNYPLMLFHACLDPWSEYSLNALTLMPFDQFLLYCYGFTLICSNYYLYRFLKSQNENNTAKSERQYIQDKKRNYVSARTGFIYVFEMVLSTIMFHFIYNFEYWTFETLSLDCSTKAYFLALYADIFECIINPCLLLAGTPGVKKTIHKLNIRNL